MTTANYAQVQMAYNYFRSNIDMKVTISDIASAIGWKESTVRTYFAKKWNELILIRAARGEYHVCMKSDMGLEDFANLHSQIDVRLR